MTDVPERAALARRAAEAGGGVAHDGFRQGLAVEHKAGKTDVVTEADRAAQRRVVEVLGEEYPDDAIVGEEADALKAVPESGHAWIIDPIDGTNNFVRNVRLWATAVAAVEDGTPLAAAVSLPALGDTYTADHEATYLDGTPVTVSNVADAEQGTVVPTVWWDFDNREEYARACEAIVSRFADLRRWGCAQATLAMVADGSVEGAITNLQCNPWDTVAGVYLVRQAGGVVTDLDGNRWRHDSRGLVASNGTLHEEVLTAAQEIDARA